MFVSKFKPRESWGPDGIWTIFGPVQDYGIVLNPSNLILTEREFVIM